MTVRRLLSCSLFLGLALIVDTMAARADQRVELIYPLPPELRAIAERYLLHDPEGVKFMRDGGLDESALDDLAGTMVDLGDKGEQVALIRLGTSFGLCGTAGCDIWIFKKIDRLWQPVGEFYSPADSVAILDKEENGYHEIAAYQPHTETRTIVTWDGKEFRAADE